MTYFSTLFLALFVLTLGASGQQEGQKSAFPESYVALNRSNVQFEKTAILTQNLSLSDEDGRKFWPLQRNYENDLEKLGDQRLELIRDYVKNWDNLSDDTAKSLGRRLLEYHKKRVELAQKYFDRISKEISPTVAAKFFQLEIQLEDLTDLAVASAVPLVK